MLTRIVAVLVVVVMLQHLAVSDLNTAFLPYGRTNGDRFLDFGDDPAKCISVSSNFPLFSTKNHQQLCISTNGYITVDTIVPFPPRIKLPTSYAVFAPYNVDLFSSGLDISYRVTNDQQILDLVDQDIALVLDRKAETTPTTFDAKSVFVVTYDNVLYLFKQNDSYTFQAIIATDFIKTFIIVNYKVLGLENATIAGLFEPGTCKNSSIPIQALLTSTSNVGIPGKHVYLSTSNDCIDFGETVKPSKLTTFIPTYRQVPQFLKGPKVTKRSDHANGLQSITGCIFVANISSLPTIKPYYLKNGNEKIFISLNQQTDFDESSVIGQFDFPVLNFTLSHFTDQGYYQCVLDIVGYGVVLSEVINIRFTDVSETRLKLNFTDRKYSNTLKNRSSEEYTVISKEIEKIVLNSIQVEEKFLTDIEVVAIRSGSLIVDVKILTANQTAKERMKRCMTSPLNKMNKELEKSSETVIVTVKSFDCCQAGSIGDENFRGVYKYNTTLVGDEVNMTCQFRSSYQVTIQCIGDLRNGPEWVDPTVFEKCPAKYETTNILLDLLKEIDCNNENKCPSALELSGNLTKAVGNDSRINTYQEVFFTQQLINAILAKINVNTSMSLKKKVIGNVLNVVSRLIDIDQRILAKSKSSNAILEDLDRLAKIIGQNLNTTNSSVSIQTENIGFRAVYRSPNGIFVGSRENLAGQQTVEIAATEEIPVIELSSYQSTLKTPHIGLDETNFLIYAFSYQKPSLFQSQKQINNDNAEAKKQPLGSNILAVTIFNKIKNKSIEIPNGTAIEISFKRMTVQRRNIPVTPVCSFWKSSSRSTGIWLSDGCHKVQDKNGVVTCQCNHLTNFALLLDVSQTSAHVIALDIVTWIGCGISLCGLLLTVIVYLSFKNLLKKLPPRILLRLCFSLIALLVVFLVGIEQTQSKIGCKIVSALIQYFTLTTFSWMAVETYNLYRCFVKIYISSSPEKFLRIASLITWGIPAIIVVVTALIAPGNLATKQFCTVNGLSFYLGVLLPVASILLFNYVLMVFIMKSLNNQYKESEQRLGIRTSTKRQLRTAFGVSTLLGLTWVFGLFTIGDLRVSFQWMFTVLNSLQGFFIFIFYTLRNPEAKKELLGCLNRRWKALKFADKPNSMKMDEIGKQQTLASDVSTLGMSSNASIINNNVEKQIFTLSKSSSVCEINNQGIQMTEEICLPLTKVQHGVDDLHFTNSNVVRNFEEVPSSISENSSKQFQKSTGDLVSHCQNHRTSSACSCLNETADNKNETKVNSSLVQNFFDGHSLTTIESESKKTTKSSDCESPHQKDIVVNKLLKNLNQKNTEAGYLAPQVQIIKSLFKKEGNSKEKYRIQPSRLAASRGERFHKPNTEVTRSGINIEHLQKQLPTASPQKSKHMNVPNNEPPGGETPLLNQDKGFHINESMKIHLEEHGNVQQTYHPGRETPLLLMNPNQNDENDCTKIGRENGPGENKFDYVTACVQEHDAEMTLSSIKRLPSIRREADDSCQ